MYRYIHIYIYTYTYIYIYIIVPFSVSVLCRGRKQQTPPQLHLVVVAELTSVRLYVFFFSEGCRCQNDPFPSWCPIWVRLHHKVRTSWVQGGLVPSASDRSIK